MDDILASGQFDHQFDVEWTNRYDTFANVIGHMYTNKEQFDLVIALDNDEQLEAHRHVMAIFSPEFKEMLESHLNSAGNLVIEKSEVVFEGIPSNIMKQVLDYVYYGLVYVPKEEVNIFCKVLDHLGIVPFTDREIKSFMNEFKPDNKPIKMVYKDRGALIAEGFKNMYCEERWCDITIEVDHIPFKAYRIALSVGSEYFRDKLKSLGPSMVATTEPVLDKDVSFEDAYDLAAFIYCGTLETKDIVHTLNAGESLKVLGMRGDIDLRGEKPKHGQPSNLHKLFATAKGIPVGDEPLCENDTVTHKIIGKAMVKSAIRMSLSSASGSEYEVEKDSDDYSDSDNAMPLVNTVKDPKPQRATKVSKKVRPQKNLNGQKRHKANASGPKQAKASGSRTKTPAHADASASNPVPNASVPDVVSNESQGEVMISISKSDYELLISLVQRNIDSGNVPDESEPQNHGEFVENEYDQHQYENDEVLDQAVDNYQQQQYAEDSNDQDLDNGDQYPHEYDDDEPMEGAVGGLVENYDENDNILKDVDESNEWAEAENGAEEDHLEDYGEDGNDDIDSEQHDAGVAKGKFRVRTWTDDDFVEIAKFDKSPRGATRLLLHGYYFTLNNSARQANDYNHWRCTKCVTKLKCKVKTHTKVIDGIEKVKYPELKHDHPREY